MTDRAHMPPSLPDALCYEELIAAEDGDYDGRLRREDRLEPLLHLGTTGNPKGVLYHASLDRHP
jgi:fatty-acyl-CoA synthase